MKDLWSHYCVSGNSDGKVVEIMSRKLLTDISVAEACKVELE